MPQNTDKTLDQVFADLVPIRIHSVCINALNTMPDAWFSCGPMADPEPFITTRAEQMKRANTAGAPVARRKFTDEQCLQIRKRKTDGLTHNQLAKEFDCSAILIYNVLHHKKPYEK